VLVLAAGLAVGGPAPAAEAAACSGSSGVTVVVDFGSLGGGVQIGCAGGSPANGLAALSGAGHGYTFVPRFPGLVCQIDTRPNPCNGAPTSAYWSYWHAARGDAWNFSMDGAGRYHPKPGTVEGWAFGAGRRPGIAPPAAPAPPRPAPKPTTNPAPGPTAQPPGAPRGSAPGAGAPPAPGAPGASAGGAPRTTGSTPGAAGTDAGRTSSAPSTSAGPTATEGTSAGAEPSTSDSASPAAVVTEPASSSSKTLGAFSLAVALIAALALAGFLIARRRRAGPPL
jgi:hypothetical protein